MFEKDKNKRKRRREWPIFKKWNLFDKFTCPLEMFTALWIKTWIVFLFLFYNAAKIKVDEKGIFPEAKPCSVKRQNIFCTLNVIIDVLFAPDFGRFFPDTDFFKKKYCPSPASFCLFPSVSQWDDKCSTKFDDIKA